MQEGVQQELHLASLARRSILNKNSDSAPPASSGAANCFFEVGVQHDQEQQANFTQRRSNRRKDVEQHFI